MSRSSGREYGRKTLNRTGGELSRVAIVHPRLIAMGGAERVIEALAVLYPQADIFVLSSEPKMVPLSLRDHKIYTSFLNDIPWIRKVYDRLMFLYPVAIEAFDLSAYDLVISSAGPAVFGVNVSQDALHVCYCHSPERTWWDQYARRQRLSRSLSRKLLYIARASYLRAWEFAAAQRVDYFVANSSYISNRVQKYFRRASTVIYPPVDTSNGYISSHHDDYFLSVGRLMPAKRVDLLIGACNRHQRRLLIAGTGPDEKRLKALAGPTIEFLGFVPDADLPALYAKCRAFLFAADEDFGIAPVEAQSYGRPVIAYGYGGSLETVRVGDSDGRSDTGVFFAEPTVESLADGILRFEARESSFIPAEIQLHARQFDTSVFMDQMRQFVDSAMARK
jgi:glycosyltransferase involved in cell wall biosynthesis